MAVVIRIFIGVLLIVSGGEKLLHHYQNFLYVIQSYEIFPVPIENIAAHIVPWIELITGIFLLLGLWLPWSLKMSALLFSGFILIVAQALVRKLPITECGCFGELLSLPPTVVLTFDSIVFLLIFWLMIRIDRARNFSLDKYFSS